MTQHTVTLDQLTEYLRAGWAKAVAHPGATAEQKVIGSLKGTFLTRLDDHGPDALMDYATGYNGALLALYDHSATPHAVKHELARQIAVTETVIAHLRALK